MNTVSVPMWSLNADGSIAANLLFHRPWDKLHSRCIEYPFAASQVGNAQTMLDVGTSQADKVWIDWLASLDADVHATDYDPLPSVEGILFHQGDVRALPLPEAMFDVVLAVSVIEHIGLTRSQTRTGNPEMDMDGDLAAVRELVRLLKPGGRLVMTFPYGIVDGLILGNEARSYTAATLCKFEAVADPEQLYYYEYQYARKRQLYEEQRSSVLFGRVLRRVTKKPAVHAETPPALPGAVTWRRIPLAASRATQQGHVDGVVCGVWRKQADG